MTPLRRVRLEKDLTQKQVAAKARLSQVSYCRIERGKRIPSVLIAIRIARALGIPPKAIGDFFRESTAE